VLSCDSTGRGDAQTHADPGGDADRGLRRRHRWPEDRHTRRSGRNRRAGTRTPSPGSGVITFGTAYNADSLLIAKPLTTFKRTVKTIAWSAEFSESAGATTVKFVFASVSKGGAESIIDQEDVAISSPTFDLLANKANLAAVAGNKAGTYVLRYIREGTVLAEGTFTLTK
jgi:hypothetical protein